MRGERLVVFGRVKRVGFRYATLSIARKRGVRGSVRNREDGVVEIRAFAAGEVLADFRDALRSEGPGRVERIEAEPIETGDAPSDFRILS